MVEQPPKKKRRWLLFVVLGVGAMLFLCIIVALLSDGSDRETTEAEPTAGVAQVAPPSDVAGTAEPTAEPTNTVKPTQTPRPSRTPAPSRTPRPSPTPTVPPTPEPTMAPIALQGSGQAATDQVDLPPGVYVAHFTHDGRRNFAVKVYQGDDWDLLINTIGTYDGQRPLVGGESQFLDIDADGSWTVTIQQIGVQLEPSFEGRGADVSGLFIPPSAGPWQIVHTGQRNFAVWAHCAGGSDLVQNEIGPVDGSRVIRFDDGPCFWEVEADGDWSLAPR